MEGFTGMGEKAEEQSWAIRRGSRGGMIWGDPNCKVSSFAIELITNFVSHGFETGG
jgi:hypothetical protein